MPATQQHDIVALVAQLKTRLGAQAASASDQELGEELQKYLDYGVPAEQALRTVLRHRGVGQEPARPAVAQQHQDGKLPYPYGARKGVYRIKPGQGARGWVYVHGVVDAQGQPVPDGEVASIAIEQDGVQGTYTHLWKPRKPRTSSAGNKLRFQNLPYFKMGETFESESFQMQNFSIYEGRKGNLFVVLPNDAGLLDLEAVPAKVETFNPNALREALLARKASRDSYRASHPRKPAPPQPGPTPAPAPQAAANPLDDQVLGVIKAREGSKGTKWDDVQHDVILLHEAGKQPTEGEVSEAVGRLMDKGLVYEPTLGILKST